MEETEPMPTAGSDPSQASTAVILGGRYQLQRVIGRGGVAEVYQAHDERLGRAVAVKIFHTDAAIPRQDLRRDSEMRLLAGLSHPNLVTVFDASSEYAGDDLAGHARERPYLVMELIAGATLAQHIANGALTESDVARIGEQLAAALGYIHARGIVHRDVKPANILLADPEPGHSTAPTAKLTDFGIARLLDDTRITMHGTTVGTANYLSPEQVTGAELTSATDIYSLGLVLIECLTGRTVYPGQGVEAAAARLHRHPEIPKGLPSAWTALLTGMVDSAPVRRPDAAHVAATLAGIAVPGSPLDATSIITAPGPTRVLSPAAAHSAIHRRRWWLLLLAAVAALVLILVLTNQSGTDQHLGPQTTPPHLSNAASTGAQTSARATGSATSTASTATTRTTSGSKAITTPLQAIAAMRTAIAQATNSGNLEPAAATDLNNRLDDITRTISGPANPGPGQGPGKPAGPANDAAHKVADFAHHLGDLANSGQLTPTGQQELADPLAALERLIPATH